MPDDPRLERLNMIGDRIIGAAIEVHRQLGPGLLESAYEACLAYELEQLGLRVERQKALPIVYKDLMLEQGYRMDLLVNSQIVLEIKAVEELTDIHQAQLLSYLKFSGCPLGYLLNFNVRLMKHGIKRKLMSKNLA